ncbi:MAG: hypothetical protein K2H64_05130, partial [Desulfovibrio sp.]|nr:hypothetical protein [Desulfovibrio sp.]
KEALTKNGEKEKIMERSRGLASRKEVVEAGADERLREKAAVQTELEKLKLDISQSLAPLGLNHGIITQDIRGKLVERRDAWLAKDKESRTTRDELEKLTREAAAGEATLKACDEELANLEKNLNRLMLEESGILADRRRLFGDKNPEEEAAKLKKAAEEAGQRALDNNRETNRLNVEAGSLTGAILEGKNLEKDREAKTAAATVAWAAFLTGEGMSEEEYFARRKTPAEISRLEEKKAALAREQTEQTALFKAVSASLAREEERNLTQASSGEIIEAIAKAEEEVKILHGEKATLERDLETQLKLKQQFREVSAAFEAQDRECAKWEELDALIGSSEGKIFRDFAQNVTLDFLLKKANRQLTRIIDRYELVRSPDKNLSIQVIDNYHGGERRPVSNLSGGESFIVSLSLALGLSAIASRKTSIDSIFLDEGFGSLDSDTLETAMTALQSLRSDNKLIGIISHVEKVKGWSMPKIETRAGKRQGTSELFGEASQTYIKRHG